MNDDGINEDLLANLCDSFLQSMNLQPDENIPELAYAAIEALLARVGPENFCFVEEVMAECMLVAVGADAELH